MTSFKKQDKAVAVEDPNTVPPVAVAIPGREETAVAAPQENKFKIGKVSGDVKRSDIKIPELKIVHNTGTLQENFEPGSLVLNAELALSDGEKPVKLTVLAFNKYYMEKVEFGTTMPRFFQTAEELAKAGLHTNWGDDGTPPPAIEAGEALVAIESAEENPHFPFSFGDKYYAIAAWKLNSQSAYNRAGKLIITAGEWNLKDGLQNGSWTLATRKEKLGKNFVYCPVLKSGPRNSKDLAEFFATLL